MSPLDERLKQQGFDRIGRIDAVGRRSLWLKVNLRPAPLTYVYNDDVESIELRAGREGDDVKAKFDRSNMSKEAFDMLVDALTTARFAAEWEDPNGNALFTAEERREAGSE